MTPSVEMDKLLRCPVCNLILCEPVSLPCGHTVCRTCLVKELRRKPKECPCCAKPCHTRAEDQPQNVMIAQIVMAMFPEELEQRLKSTQAEKADFGVCLPAFFYNVPVFPGQSMCLHFYEDRYKIMMKRIIDTSRRFAYVLPALTRNRNSGSRVEDHIALVAQVCEAEFLCDDRVMVKVQFSGRYNVVSDTVEEGTGGLHYCSIEAFDDDPANDGRDGDELKDLYAQAKAMCHGFLGPFKSQLVQAYGPMPSDAVMLSMWMASFLPFYGPEKQSLLESRSTRDRLHACLRCAASMEELARASSMLREEKNSAGDAGASLPPTPRPLYLPSEAADTMGAETSAETSVETTSEADVAAQSWAVDDSSSPPPPPPPPAEERMFR